MTQRPDLRVSIDVLHHILGLLELEFVMEGSLEERKRVVDIGFICAIGFSAALRGEEIMMIDLFSLKEH